MNSIREVKWAMRSGADPAEVDVAIKALLRRSDEIYAEAQRALRDDDDLRPALARYLRRTHELHGMGSLADLIAAMSKAGDTMMSDLAAAAWGLRL